jgi:CHAT domain-containing protein
LPSDEQLLSSRLSLAVLLLLVVACNRHERASLGEVYQQASLLQRQDDTQRALFVANQGLKRALEERNDIYYWKFRLLKAEVLLAQGNTNQARALIEGNIPPSPVAAELTARQWLDRGWAEFSISHIHNSLVCYERAAQAARRAGSQSLITQTELARGNSLVRLGIVEEAGTVFLDALRQARLQGDTYNEARALGNLGYLRMSEARYDEAIPFFHQADVLFERIPSRRFIARTLDNLGLCEFQLGETKKALPLYEEAGNRASSAALWSDEQVSLGRVGDCYYYGNGDFKDAVVYYRRALEIARRTQDEYWIANWLYQLASTSVDAGDLANAEQYNNEALALQEEMQNPVERLYPLLNSAQIAVARHQTDQAKKIYESIIASAAGETGLRNPELLIEARSGMAQLMAKTGRLREAEDQFRKTLDAINTTRSELIEDEHRITYLASLVRFYQAYVEYLAGRGRDGDALLVAESSRARLLSERLRGTVRSQGRTSIARLQDLSRRFRTTLFAYWLAPSRSFLWVITPTGLRTFVLPPQEVIADRVEAYRRAIDNLEDPLVTGNPAGEALYETVLAPARSLVRPGSRIAIVPDGALYNLNFESIPIPTPSPHYLIADATISVAPSLSMLVDLSRPEKSRLAELLLIGNPSNTGDPQFPPLVNAKLEVEQVQEQFPSHSELVLTGPSAQRGTYAAAHPERFSFIHFAAHATANREDPLDSAIVLSPLGTSYKLYARDIMRIPIHASLVTLSACNSAGAQAYAGEGLVGFAWAFLSAGAHDVIGSLWEVDDRSTSQLMARLYQELSHGATPATALRNAQLSLVKSKGPFHKPYYWAPFELFTTSLGTQSHPRWEKNVQN